MMLLSRSDEFGLVHERRNETGETDTRRDSSQVRTTQVYASEHSEHAERARPRWARGSSLAGGSTVAGMKRA